MRTVGIRELKAHLSRILHDVASGDVFLVTDRGRVVAELRQPDAYTTAATPEERALARLAAAGRLRTSERPAGKYRRSPIKSRPGAAKSILDSERGE